MRYTIFWFAASFLFFLALFVALFLVVELVAG